MAQTTKGALVVIDGFGANPNTKGNAVLSANTPNLDSLWSNYPHTLLKASEEEVGLSFGQIGNSEVGHMAIGTGRVIPSPSQRVNQAIQDGSFFTNEAFTSAVNYLKKSNGKLHLVGMISQAGVHADVHHMIALLALAKSQGIKNVYLHPILDGRDTGPKEAEIYLNMLKAAIQKYGIGKIATMAGRSIAMDRNKNWVKTKSYFDLLTKGLGKSANDPITALKNAYAEGFDDETMPTTILDKNGLVNDYDALIFTNFRPDRARQISHALANPNFNNFQRDKAPQIMFVSMMQYDKDLKVWVAFPPLSVKNSLTEVFSNAGLRQLHIAETEKYAHVTYFLNGGREEKLPGEEYINIASFPPGKLDEHPEMKAEEIANTAVKNIDASKYDFYIINFANPDMIGHTGNFDNAVSAIQSVDAAIGKIAEKIVKGGGYLFITADHGNSEQMVDIKTGELSKDHTINPVPFIMAHQGRRKEGGQVQKVTQGGKVTGILQDVSPTILTNMGFEIPPEMTGVKLF